MQIDVQQPLEFRSSPIRLGLIAAGALGMSAVGLALGWRLLPGVAPGSFKQFAGWAGAVFFAACFVVAVWRLFGTGRPTLSLSPAGFRDIRMSSAWVPWAAVEKLSVWGAPGSRFIVVKVSEAVSRSLPLTRSARWTQSANKSLGVDGLAVSVTEFSGDFNDFFAAFVQYAKAHGGLADPRQPRHTPAATSAPKQAAADYTKPSAFLKPFPAAQDVFIAEQVDLESYLHPLVSVDLNAINPDWSGWVHIVSPIEPLAGMGYVGTATEAFHNAYLGENCIIFKVEGDRYRFMGDRRYFLANWPEAEVTADLRDEYVELREQYREQEASYRNGLDTYRRLGSVHCVEPDGRFKFDNPEPYPLIEKLGGAAEFWNLHFSLDLAVEETLTPDGRKVQVIPTSRAGHRFVHVASVPGYFYRSHGADSIVLFYEPVEKLALIIFDWS
ncbi:hypothetical protein EN850_03245 [Mesorhizobium sp. M8A.F.Ca.ET.207.01.1.1]|uniref:STM3941 family protein n=1 Tax=Mesorhizobium sp. M8A.F.Ca.ET.207.01.1.1 TaxID=2563968 RepID=UPI00109C6538|nr:STM3941 family protein [Mesorhizobium sp. M8A.F.Ca.ET.207.01.1.1]TGQ83774.1 hypothetical protein EN850_03245 [Mesorhizobium sp. M8A.F.Ca.ET.207.01.1.1]